jgi:hypothetical protein
MRHKAVSTIKPSTESDDCNSSWNFEKDRSLISWGSFFGLSLKLKIKTFVNTAVTTT